MASERHNKSLVGQNAAYEEWCAARDRVIGYFESLGKTINAFGKADFWVVDECFFSCLIQVEITDWGLLRPDTIDGIRDFLTVIPKFEMTIQVCHPGPYRDDWPRMGLTLYQGKISDGLKRDYLPAPYNTYFYTNSRPDNRPDLPFV